MNRDRVIYSNRTESGQVLAKYLEEFRGSDALVLGIPRGGVLVAAEIAKTLDLPLDVVIPRKLGAPDQPELAIGAVAVEDGVSVILDEKTIQLLRIQEEYIREAVEREADEIRRRTLRYREGRPAPEIRNRSVILVDDGVATGYTTRAAIRSIRAREPEQIILAVPVAPPETAEQLKREVDRFICPVQPEPFFAVGAWYAEFPQVSDQEVVDILRKQKPSAPILAGTDGSY